MPVMLATSPPPATPWSTHPTRIVAGSSQPPSLHNASFSISTHTLKLRNWTAGEAKVHGLPGLAGKLGLYIDKVRLSGLKDREI